MKNRMTMIIIIINALFILFELLGEKKKKKKFHVGHMIVYMRAKNGSSYTNILLFPSSSIFPFFFVSFFFLFFFFTFFLFNLLFSMSLVLSLAHTHTHTHTHNSSAIYSPPSFSPFWLTFTPLTPHSR